MKIDELTLGDIAELCRRYGAFFGTPPQGANDAAPLPHPMLGRRCIIRTYSAGVHIGTVADVRGKEVLLTDALRLWKWDGGGLSLSAVANDGIRGGRLNYTGQICLTEAIEFIPTTPEAEETYVKFIE